MKSQMVRLCVVGAILLTALMMCASLARAQTAESTYKAKCAGCHGADGRGDTAAGKAMGVHDFLSESVQKMCNAEMEEIITKGKNKMPAYGKSLSSSEIKELVAYIRDLAKKK